MVYKYTHFIPENIAPPEAKTIRVFNNSGARVCDISLGILKYNNAEKLYSFGLLSDLHVSGLDSNDEYLDEALTFFESQSCSFCCHAGDITNIGFWYDSADTEMYLVQMARYKSIIDAHPNLPVYGICGNHESYNKPIIKNLTELKEYTYRDLYYTYTNGDDVFIFMGQPGGTTSVEESEWKNELQWLYETLEANRNKRCFVFEHLTLKDDSGNPNNIHNAYWGTLENTLVGIMQHYKNALLFHGHSHLYFTEQEKWSYSNYSTKKGFKSVHVPSCGGSRITVNNEVEKNNRAELRSGYLVDVYNSCIVLRGYNFHTKELVPIGTYKIDTVLQSIEANTFVDGTSIIKVK
jgi:predicted phosphodiesterase